jgi:hypothetical protein
MSFVKGVGFKPITSLSEDSIKVFPRSDATTAPFPPPDMKYYCKDYYNYINIPLITGSSYKMCPRVGLSVKRTGKLGGPEAGRSVKL